MSVKSNVLCNALLDYSSNRKNGVFSQEETDSNSCLNVLYRVLWDAFTLTSLVVPSSCSGGIGLSTDGSRGISTGRLGTKEFSSQPIRWETRNPALKRSIGSRRIQIGSAEELVAILHRNVT